MMGQTHYNIIESVAAGGSWRAAIANSKAMGFSKVRIPLYRWGPIHHGRKSIYPDIIPFAPARPGQISRIPNRGTLANHNQLNLKFWDDFDTLVEYVHEQGMVADLILFNDGGPSYGQGVGGAGSGRMQNERYIKYALARLAGKTNVTWCMANEYDYVEAAREDDTELAALAMDMLMGRATPPPTRR
jgi:Protein of unknown function (DUF4038)